MPWQTALKALGSLGGATGLVTLLGLWLRDLPDALAARDQSERCAKLAILAPALQLESAAERATAIKFLINVGIMDDEGTRLATLVKDSASIPKLDAAIVTSACGGSVRVAPGPAPAPAPGGGRAGDGKIEVVPEADRLR